MHRSKAKKVLAAKQLAAYFRDQGKIPETLEEYAAMPRFPLLPQFVNKLFRGMKPMRQFVIMVDRTIEADLAPKPKAAPKPKPKVKANDTKNV